DHRDAWVRIAQAGHELGNHTIFHPCRNPGNARSWPPVHRNLCDYTLARWEDEVRVASRVLRSYDGRAQRSFGNTCCDVVAGPEESPIPLAGATRRHFVVGRGPQLDNVIAPRAATPARLGCYAADDKPFEALRAQIDETVARGGWTIF